MFRLNKTETVGAIKWKENTIPEKLSGYWYSSYYTPDSALYSHRLASTCLCVAQHECQDMWGVVSSLGLLSILTWTLLSKQITYNMSDET